MSTSEFSRKLTRFARWLCFGAVMWSAGADASDCAIGLKTGGAPTNIDGLEAGEWADASVLDSASPCFGQLMDFVSANSSYPNRNVTVKSKRYLRGGNWYLGFLFEVQDLTSTGPCAAGKLCIGEKIIMQFNRVINGDAKLSLAEDKRFTLTHHWSSSGSAITDGSITVAPPINDASCPAVSTVDTKWGPPGGNGINFGIRNDVVGGGYRAEIEVPVNFVMGAAGDLSNDIGVAFAVVNDFGKNSFGAPPDFDCTVAGTCEGAGLSFPSSLPETNDANPVDSICDKGWVVPKQWAVGYRNSPPGQVTISRSPSYYTSNGIEVRECDSSGYTYYPDKPCKVTIRANVRNNGAATRRKVAFLWAKHGTGDPTEYNFVDFKEAVVAAGTPAAQSSTWVESALWSGMPAHQANHPCLRVYIFPDGLSAADEAIVRGAATGGTVTKAALDGVVTANLVEDQHWAQKNISRHDTVTQCPNPDCRIGSLGPIRLEIISAAAAADRALLAPGRLTGIATAQGTTVPVSGADWERYSKDHIIVHARTIAYRQLKGNRKPLFSFVEDFGGVVQLFPVSMVQANAELPVEFQVSNGSGSIMHVKLLTEMHVPAGVSGIKLKVAKSEFTLQPQEVTTIRGSVANPGAHPPCEGVASVCCEFTRRDGVALGTGVLLIGFVGAVAARRRRRG
jgi:hypothetical protein